MMRMALAVAVSLFLAACQGGDVDEVTLAQLTRLQTDFDGRVVVAAGTLRTHPDPEHYWIEDDEFNRVELAGRSDLAPLVGKRVVVRGLFRYDPAEGRAIDVEYLSPSP